MAPAFDAVFFDWCGTIVGYPSTEERLRPVLDQLSRPTTDGELGEIAAAIHAAEGHPDAIDADTRCDLSRAGHAEAKRVVCELAGIDEELGLAFERSFADLTTYPSTQKRPTSSIASAPTASRW